MRVTNESIIHKSSRGNKKGVKYLIITLPFLIFVFAFSYVPLFGWLFSIYEFKFGQSLHNLEFVGAQYFIKLVTDSNIMRVLRNTLVMSLLRIITTPLPVIFAIILNDVKRQKVKKFVQTVTTLPNFISWIVVYGLAFSLFSTHGVLNDLLKLFHLPYPEFGLLGDASNVWWFQLALSVWKGLGWETIIYMAAITGIDTELYNAAKVDGANKLQLILHVTIPGLASTYFVLLLLNVSNLLNSGFEQYYVFWNAMVSDKIEVLDFYIYKLGFQLHQYSYSVTVGMLKSLVSIALLFLVNGISKKIRGASLV